MLRVHAVELLPRVAKGREVRHLHVRVHGQQPHDLRPGVPRSAQYRDLGLLAARGHRQGRAGHIRSPPRRRAQRRAVERAPLRGPARQARCGGGLRDDGLHCCGR
eukprot:8402583-Pyramimonas_sp.AAC.1